MNKKYNALLLSLMLFSCGGSSDVDDSNAADNTIATPDIVIDTEVTKPNILLILADDQGLDASAQYAYSTDKPTTPTLNALAEQGIVFENVWATPACTTTRGTIITGQHGINSGIDYVPAEMPSETTTLQRYIKAQDISSDYQTAVIGKWHLAGGNPDLNHVLDSGVDYFAGTIAGTIDDYYDWPLTQDGVNARSNEYHTTKITDLAIHWLDEQNQQEKPWFLWLAYVAPHSPFHLPPEHLHNRDNLTGTASDINANKRDYYLAAIEAMDSEIGRLLASMSTEERENTLIIYMGDNGTPVAVIDSSVFEQGHHKGSLYEGGIRVPMIASGYSVTRKNERETALINSTDLFASIANVAGSSISHINDSYDFTRLFSRESGNLSTPLRSVNYSEFVSANVTGWAMRNDQFKLIQFDAGDRALFDISESLSESDDLILNTSTIADELSVMGEAIRNEANVSPLDITNAIFVNRSANCADYVEHYQSSVFDVNNSALFDGDLVISVLNNKCIFQTNNIPNHDFNDGGQAFPNNVSAQNNSFEITVNPVHATTSTNISLQADNAILLNGVKVDLLAAACFGVGDGKVGCNDINQPWRYDPMFSANGFRVDSHNAHSQPDGSYHYHGTPNAFYAENDNSAASPVVGFAADGYPIYGPYIDDDGSIRKVNSSFRL
ncbi:MAG: sulfatase-like hydrolase/transferase, partial [Colwellia sp.]|nr:sulfatase-like hydrolase/transferase [Colwellia sp.]